MIHLLCGATNTVDENPRRRAKRAILERYNTDRSTLSAELYRQDFQRLVVVAKPQHGDWKQRHELRARGELAAEMH
jgi:hypothetical protein